MEFKWELKASADQGAPEVIEITGTAYTGGYLRLRDDMVVDVEGVLIPDEVPLLADHENSVTHRIGSAIVVKENGALTLCGQIVDSSEEAHAVIAQLKAGQAYQMSIGASECACVEYIAAEHEEPVTINGMQLDRDCVIVTACQLDEVSVVALGADNQTRVIKASLKPRVDAVIAPVEEATEPQEEAPAPVVEAEAKQPEITAASAVEETPDNAGNSAAVIRAERPSAGNIQAKKPKEGKMPNEILKAALLMRAGVPENEITDNRELAIQARSRVANVGLRALVREYANTDTINRDAITAAFSTTDLPNVLADVANKVMMRGYKMASAVAPIVCSHYDLPDYRPTKLASLAANTALAEVAKDGEVEIGELGDEGVDIQLKQYAKAIVITEQDIINDDIGAFLRLPEIMGARAAQKQDELLLAALTAAGNFSTTNKNVVAGTEGAFDADALKKAIAALKSQADKHGNRLAHQPKWLIVSPENEFNAIELTQSVSMVGGTTAHPALNALSLAGIGVVALPGLTGNTAYLTAAPGISDALVLGTLRGQSAPRVESGALDYRSFGTYFRVSFPAACVVGDKKAIVKIN